MIGAMYRLFDAADARILLEAQRLSVAEIKASMIVTEELQSRIANFTLQIGRRLQRSQRAFDANEIAAATSAFLLKGHCQAE